MKIRMPFQSMPVRMAARVAAISVVCMSGAFVAASATPFPGYVNELNFLEFAIDHHFSALRMTELAAGTATVGSTSGFSGSPDTFPPSSQKGTDPVVLSIATTANAAQRSDITNMEGFLNTYYGINSFPPMVLPENKSMIDTLVAASPGDPFNIAFLEQFTLHHADLMGPAQECASVAPHAPVRAMCAMMVSSQTQQMTLMIADLKDKYGIDFSVPEPGSIAYLLGAMVALLCFGSRRNRNSVKAA